MSSDPTPNVISLLASQDGPTPWPLPDGRLADPVGLAARLVSLSARQARGLGLQTSGIYGPPGSISSRSADLQSSLASKLRQRLGTAGLIEQSVTWKEMATPSGALYCRRAAQVRPISATGCGSLPTPSGTSNHGRNHVAGRLDEWGGSSNPFRRGRTFENLGSVHSPAFELWTMGYPAAWREQMPPATPSSRRSARSSSPASSTSNSSE